ncbi:MAG: cache domain-containing protein [Chloroflexota bacterium]|nr:cache domain-containing protein [Chloroflexota bacterium]
MTRLPVDGDRAMREERAMQEIWERVKVNADAIMATLAGILAIVALIIAIAGTTGVTRDETREMIDDAVMRVADPPGYAQAFVAQAIDRYEAEGRDATVDYYNTRESVDGPWYVIVYDENTETIAHPTRKDFLGQSPRERTDVTGNSYGEEIASATEDGRWVDYVFVNPASGEPERKHTWVIKHDGLLFASGWYEPISREDDPATYTQAVVASAISRYDAGGREASIAYHQSEESIDGPWYVFLLDENGYVLANPARPDFVGTTPAVRSDITGKPYGLEVVAADENGRWVDYVFVNPVTGEPERKHTWVIKHDGLSFASGWYEPISRTDDPATFTQAFVARALSRYNAEGLDATVAHYNTPESLEGQWYVFIFDEADRLLTHPDPSLLGDDLKGSLGTDITGRVFGLEMLQADEDGIWVSYVFVNPANGQPQVKHSWVVRHDGLLFGSGWYESVPGEDQLPVSGEDHFAAVVVPSDG